MSKLILKIVGLMFIVAVVWTVYIVIVSASLKQLLEHHTQIYWERLYRIQDCRNVGINEEHNVVWACRDGLRIGDKQEQAQ